MGWKQRRVERRLELLDAQREKLLDKVDGRRYDDMRQSDTRGRGANRRYNVVDDRPVYDDRRTRREQHSVNTESVEKMKADFGKIAEETLSGMPQDLTPTEVLFVITVMIKMVCLLIDDK